MKVLRIVANIATSEPTRAREFYGELFGLEVLMDHGFITTYGSERTMTVQLSVASEGGSGTPVPDLSIEVDDVEAALARVRKANIPIEYGPVDEPWGVRRFYVRDPFGKGPRMAKSVDDRGRGARLARRDEGAYSLYVIEEQRSQSGCIGREGGRLCHSRALSS